MYLFEHEEVCLSRCLSLCMHGVGVYAFVCACLYAVYVGMDVCTGVCLHACASFSVCLCLPLSLFLSFYVPVCLCLRMSVP